MRTPGEREQKGGTHETADRPAGKGRSGIGVNTRGVQGRKVTIHYSGKTGHLEVWYLLKVLTVNRLPRSLKVIGSTFSSRTSI